MKLNAAELMLITIAVDRAWRLVKQPEFTVDERQELCELAIKLKCELKKVEVEI